VEGLWTVLFVGAVIAVLVRVLWPVFGAPEEWSSAGETELDRLLGEKARVLRALKDLEHERAGGFLNEREFTETRRDYMEQAAQLNRELTRLTGVRPARRSTPADSAPPGAASTDSGPGRKEEVSS